MLTAAAIVPVWLAATYLIPALYGSEFTGAITPAHIILIGLAPQGIAAVITAFLYGVGRPGLNSWAMAVGLVATVVLDLLLIPRFGAVGAASASAVAYASSTLALVCLFGWVNRPARTAAGETGRASRERTRDSKPLTGAAGFIGSRLTETLRSRGDDVVAVDSFTDYYDPDRKRENARDLDVLDFDLETNDLDPLIGAVDRVFHLAGQPGVRASFGAGFELYARRNLMATARLFEAAASNGVRVTYASSSSVYGDAEAYPTPEDVQPRPISPYGVTKLCCEHLAYAYARMGLDAVGLRYFTVYGPRQRPDMAFTTMLEALASGRAFPLYGDGSASRSFTYVDDAVSGTIAAMERGEAGSIYNIGGGEEASMIDVFELARRVSGRTLRIERLGAAPGDVRRTRADGTRAFAHLGWEASTPLAEGLAEHWKWVAERVGCEEWAVSPSYAPAPLPAHSR